MTDDDRRYAEDVRRATRPRSLAEDLAELEATNPEVAAAAAKLDRVMRRDRTGCCPFCSIITGNAPATILRWWPDAVAIEPLHSVTPGHTLVIPIEHVPDFTTDPAVSAAVMRRAAELAHDSCEALNLITSAGSAATQTVPHLHLHLVPREHGDSLALPWDPATEAADV